MKCALFGTLGALTVLVIAAVLYSQWLDGKEIDRNCLVRQPITVRHLMATIFEGFRKTDAFKAVS
jgi:hypothetical protein